MLLVPTGTLRDSGPRRCERDKTGVNESGGNWAWNDVQMIVAGVFGKNK